MSCFLTASLSLFSPPQPREKGRMRFHKLQNVQIALDFLKHRQVCPQTLKKKKIIKWHCPVTEYLVVPVFSAPNTVFFSGQAGQHQKWWHRRWEPQADPGVNMDHHPPLPGLLLCQCCVLLYYRSLPLSLGSDNYQLLFPISLGPIRGDSTLHKDIF